MVSQQQVRLSIYLLYHLVETSYCTELKYLLD